MASPAHLYTATIPFGTAGRRVPDLFGAGYSGWGDITYPESIRLLKQVRVRYLRMPVELDALCGEYEGDYRWDYCTPKDLETGFTDRVRRLLANGWTPIVCLSIHNEPMMPKWFHGVTNDTQGRSWCRYNLDGTRVSDGYGDQMAAVTRIARAVASHLASHGMKGLIWETIYELGPEMPLVDIHHAAALGIRQADRTARVMGPATWPGWSVEERFVKPYLTRFGPELLDYVSMHWYMNCDHRLWKLGYTPDQHLLTMEDTKYLSWILEHVGDYANWSKSVRAVLDDRRLNKQGKPIGVVYSEYDLTAMSAYGRNPENPRWPEYNPAADCYINTNWFGGVWNAAVLCSVAARGCADILCKFATNNMYGLLECTTHPQTGLPYRYYGQPIWFAWRLLQERAGLRPGARICSAVTTPGSCDGCDVYGVVQQAGRASVVIINRTFNPVRVALDLLGLPCGASRITMYRFDQKRSAPFLGRRPGYSAEGRFADAPDTSRNLESLKPIGPVVFRPHGQHMRLQTLFCSPVSVTVLTIG